MQSHINTRMDSQILAYKSLHKGQIHLEENLNLVMQQAGINSSQQSSGIDGDQKGGNMEEQVGREYMEYHMTKRPTHLNKKRQVEENPPPSR